MQIEEITNLDAYELVRKIKTGELSIEDIANSYLAANPIKEAIQNWAALTKNGVSALISHAKNQNQEKNTFRGALDNTKPA